MTVYAGVDFDADPDTATLTHIVRGGDYTPVSAASVKVRVTDPDTQGVSVSTSALTIAAGGTRYLYGGAGYPANEHGIHYD